MAAFDDLQVAVEDDTSTRQTIQSLLAVLTCALELAGHTSAQVCRFVSEIVDDQLREIDLAHQIIDGTTASGGLPAALGTTFGQASAKAALQSSPKPLSSRPK